MNKIYKTVWNAEKGTYVAASELVHTKAGSGSSVLGNLVNDIGKPLQFVRLNHIATLLLLASLGIASHTAQASSGIFINDGTDAGCTWIIDSNQTTIAGNYNQTLGISSSTTVKWGSAATWNVPSQAQVGGAPGMTCVSTDKDSQTNRVLFYGDASASGSKHLTLGGRLDVNAGVIGVGDRAGNNSIRIGGGTSLTDAAGVKSIVLGYNSKAAGSNAIALGNEANAAGNQAIVLGLNAKAAANNTLAMGNDANAFGDRAIAMGYQAKALGANTVALGNSAIASVDRSVAVGMGTRAYGDSGLAMGHMAQVDAGADYAISLGASAQAKGIASIAIGTGAVAHTRDAVAIGGRLG